MVPENVRARGLLICLTFSGEKDSMRLIIFILQQCHGRETQGLPGNATPAEQLKWQGERLLLELAGTAA